MPFKDENKRKEYARLRYQKNKEKLSEKSKELYKVKKEEIKLRTSIYRANNKEKLREYYSNTKEVQIQQVLQRRENNKAEYILLKGGKCEICGFEYNGENAACFDFHHENPEEKEYNPSTAIRLRREKALKELEKCQLVCANCHRLIHYKTITYERKEKCMEGLTTNATAVIDLVKQCMGIFTEFPMNILLVAGLVGVGFGIFRKAKRSAN